MSDLKLEGTITAIFDKQQVTDSFAKREFVIETAEEYKQEVKFEFTQNKCDELDKVKVGQLVDVHFNVRGRKWRNEKKGEDVYFVTLNAWRLESVGSSENKPVDKYAEVPPADDSINMELPF